MRSQKNLIFFRSGSKIFNVTDIAFKMSGFSQRLINPLKTVLFIKSLRRFHILQRLQIAAAVIQLRICQCCFQQNGRDACSSCAWKTVHFLQFAHILKAGQPADAHAALNPAVCPDSNPVAVSFRIVDLRKTAEVRIGPGSAFMIGAELLQAASYDPFDLSVVFFSDFPDCILYTCFSPRLISDS